jgi:hypothetical protein
MSNAETLLSALEVIDAMLADAIADCATWQKSAGITRGSREAAVARMANLITCREYLHGLASKYPS